MGASSTTLVEYGVNEVNANGISEVSGHWEQMHRSYWYSW